MLTDITNKVINMMPVLLLSSSSLSLLSRLSIISTSSNNHIDSNSYAYILYLRTYVATVCNLYNLLSHSYIRSYMYDDR